MQDDNHARGPRRRATVLKWAERLFVTTGIFMLGWCALVLADTEFSQRQARHSLDTVSLAAAAPPPMTDRASQPAVSASTLRRGVAIAALSIPKVALGAVVLHGSDAQTLRRGPGHLEDTALPGEAGNVVIAGHRDSFFRGLGEVVVGDDVFIDTPERHLHYRVASTRVVNAHDLSVLEQTGDAILTLITCYPFWILGPAPDRFVVRATLVSNTSFLSHAVPTPAPHESTRAQSPSQIGTGDGAIEDMTARHDEVTLVREAIERFRVTYNARLVSRNEVRPGGLLQFHGCDIAITEHRAIATCATGSPSEPSDDAGVWTLTLERADHRWAMKTVVSD